MDREPVSRIDAPRDVELREVKRARKSSRASAADMISEAYAIAYEVPKLLGYGRHWPLDPDEAKLLGARTDRLIQSMPARRKAAWMKRLDKWMPGVSLVTAAATITAPRVMQTMHDLQEAKRVRSIQARQPTPARAGSGHGNAVPNNAGPAPVSRPSYPADDTRYVPLTGDDARELFDAVD